MNTILLFSGGLDSYIGWHFVGRPPAMYAALGHRYQHQELTKATQLIPGLQMAGLVNLGDFEAPDAFIPMRNLFLVQTAVMHGADKVWLICQEDEMNIPDRSEKFFRETSSILSYLMGRPIEVDTPFADMDKTDMVKWYLGTGEPVENLRQTYSCYKGQAIPCGACPACIRRYIAMSLNGIEEEYEQDPKESETASKYRAAAAQSPFIYSNKRNDRILKALSLRNEETGKS